MHVLVLCEPSHYIVLFTCARQEFDMSRGASDSMQGPSCYGAPVCCLSEGAALRAGTAVLPPAQALAVHPGSVPP